MIFLAVFILGAVIGSFLNVLVYRLPEGMSLVHPPSHCPKCGKPVRPYDNVPIVGWLILRGRCRDCKEPISVRYPIVELLTALLFVAVAVAEQNSIATQPTRAGYPSETRVAEDRTSELVTSEAENSVLSVPMSDTQIAGRYFYRVFLVCGLWAAFLMQLDDKRIPWRFFIVLFVVGFLSPIIWPRLHPLPGVPLRLSGSLSGLVDVTLGAVPGLLFLLGVRLCAKNRPALFEGAMGLVVAGVFLGVYCAVILAAFLFLNMLLIATRGNRPGPLIFLPTGWLLLGALALLFQPPV